MGLIGLFFSRGAVSLPVVWSWASSVFKERSGCAVRTILLHRTRAVFRFNAGRRYNIKGQNVGLRSSVARGTAPQCLEMPTQSGVYAARPDQLASSVTNRAFRLIPR